MFFRFVLLFFSLVSFLHSVHVSGSGQNCADKPVFTPSRLVVKFGDPAFASCSVCQHACLYNLFGLEKTVGHSTTNKTRISWTVDNMTEWDTSAICYYNDNKTHSQCWSILPVTVYQPPDNVSISFINNHTGAMFEDHQYTLQCRVQNVAPVENLTVTFYRGQTVLRQLQSNNTQTKPVTEIFTLNITPRKEDDGAQYWCEAKLELGPEGPRRPPVVMSQNIPTTVYYKPQLDHPSYPDPITILSGHRLQLNCSALGNPRPSYTWTLPANISTFNGSTLTISSVAVEDKGQYTCSVSNNMGTITVKYNVDVQANYILYIILGIIAAAVVLVIVGLIVYNRYYKHNKMGRYNLFKLKPLGPLI